MREIKFRAWDISYKKIITNFAINSVWEEWISWFVLMLNWVDEKVSKIIHDESWYNIMQYTWLKDKNGTEIYEWDVLSSGWASSYKESISQVIYKRQLGRYMKKYNFRWEEVGLDTVVCIRWEVIWNIYENPNLINND